MVGISEEGHNRCLVLFTKPPRPGRVKTRLIGDLTPEQAAELHAAFLEDLKTRLGSSGAFSLRFAWALEEGEAPPWNEPPGKLQQGNDLGERLLQGLGSFGQRFRYVAAVGSDLPTLEAAQVEDAFARLEAGVDVVLGPVEDGGYFLIALAAETLRPELFARIEWSTDRVLTQTQERCRALGLTTALLPLERDIDTPADLEAFCELLANRPEEQGFTRQLLASWGRLPASPKTVHKEAAPLSGATTPPRHSRESGNPDCAEAPKVDPRLRGDDQQGSEGERRTAHSALVGVA